MDTVTYEREHKWKCAASDFFKENFFDPSNKTVCVNDYRILLCVDKKNRLGLSGLISCKPQENRKMPSLGVAVLLNTVNKAAFIAVFHFTFNPEIQRRASFQSNGCFVLPPLHSTSNFRYYICVCWCCGKWCEEIFGLGQVNAHPSIDAVLFE